MRLQNQVAIVTGGGSGMGEAIAKTYAREGARVAVIDVDGAAAGKVAKEIGKAAIAVRCDVVKRGDIDAAVAETVKAFGRLDVLVNNAGVAHVNKPMLDIGEAEFDRVFAVNVKTLAVELAPDKIRIVAIAPVATDTPLLPTFLGPAPGMREKFIATVPLGRLAMAQDIADAALFLASEEAKFLTGNIMEVDGGRCV